jgi:hypothetical protein
MTKTISKAAKKYIDIINSGRITEREIISMRSLINRDKEARNEIFEAWDDKELELDPAQQQKGYDFLMNQWKTPTGTERKNNPFGYREQEILEDFRDLTLKSLYNAGNYHVDNYLPLYSCNSKDGNGFEYYYNGKVNIVG